MITPERHEEIKKQIMDLLEHGIAKDQSETDDTEAYADEHGFHKSRRSRKALNESEIAEALGINGAETGEMVTCLDELEAQAAASDNRALNAHNVQQVEQAHARGL